MVFSGFAKCKHPFFLIMMFKSVLFSQIQAKIKMIFFTRNDWPQNFVLQLGFH